MNSNGLTTMKVEDLCSKQKNGTQDPEVRGTQLLITLTDWTSQL